MKVPKIPEIIASKIVFSISESSSRSISLLKCNHNKKKKSGVTLNLSE